MSKLKTLLASLLSLFWSKQENESLSQLSLSSNNAVSTTSLAGSETDQTFVSPCNGFVVVRSENGNIRTLVLESDGLRYVFSQSERNLWMTNFIPVKKGSNVIARADALTAGTLCFISSVGSSS